MKKTIIIIAAIAVIAAGYMVFRKQYSGGMASEQEIPNSLSIESQDPGWNVIANSVMAAASGFVVIQEVTDGAPGVVLGTSDVLPKGWSEHVVIGLSRPVEDGQILSATLYKDNGDGSFNASDDTVIMNKVGDEPVMSLFPINEGSAPLP